MLLPLYQSACDSWIRGYLSVARNSHSLCLQELGAVKLSKKSCGLWFCIRFTAFHSAWYVAVGKLWESIEKDFFLCLSNSAKLWQPTLTWRPGSISYLLIVAFVCCSVQCGAVLGSWDLTFYQQNTIWLDCFWMPSLVQVCSCMWQYLLGCGPSGDTLHIPVQLSARLPLANSWAAGWVCSGQVWVGTRYVASIAYHLSDTENWVLAAQ